jgi:hypothetical protein
MRRLSSKRGSGHLEIILSFVFFTGFMVFLFLTLKPYDTKSILDSVNKGVAKSFEEKVSTNLTVFFLKVNYTDFPIDKDCFSIDLPPKTFFMYDFTNIYVDDFQEGVNASINSGGKLEIEKGSDSFRVFVSPEFEDENLPGCHKIGNYKMGNILERKVLSYKSLIELKVNYNSNYELVKEELKIPEVLDFTITCDELPEINMEKTAPSSGEVSSRDFIYEVLKSDGSVINARFIVRVW